jgi:hypothetical protein
MTDNAADSMQDFIRLRAEVEALGRDKRIRRAVERGDPASLCGLTEVLQLTSSEAVDLIVAFAVLRYSGASEGRHRGAETTGIGAVCVSSTMSARRSHS